MDLLKLFREDPAGWTAVGITVIALLASAVFWRRARSALKAIGRGGVAVLRWIFSIRITTEPRIRRRIERAVEASHLPRPPVKYWQWVRDPRPGHWRLENHTGETCTVMEIEFDTASGWGWRTFPNFPVRLRDGQALDLHGSISVPTFGLLTAGEPGATVRWVDSHHDEDAMWTPFKDGLKFG